MRHSRYFTVCCWQRMAQAFIQVMPSCCRLTSRPPIRFIFFENQWCPCLHVGHFAERTNDLSNGLIWPKDG